MAFYTGFMFPGGMKMNVVDTVKKFVDDLAREVHTDHMKLTDLWIGEYEHFRA